MRFMGKLALSAAVLSLVAAQGLSAQRWKFDFGINGGYSKFTDVLGAEDTGLGDDVAGSKLHFSSGGLLGTQLTYWIGPKMGLRANLRYGDRSLKGNDLDDFAYIGNINLWGGTGDLMFRFKAPAEEYTKMEVLPYLALGAGMKWHNPAGDRFTCTDGQETKSWSCHPFYTPGEAWALGEQKVFAGHLGLGADWRVSRGIAIRTELSDQIFQPQIHKAEGTGFDINLPDGDENESKWVHELGAQVGLHFLFGIARPVAVAVIPAPPVVTQPPPEPVRPPVVTPPPPAPTRSSVTVCVIDPSAPGGIRMETTAFYMSNSPRDTMIVVNGQDVLLRNAVGNLVVAQNADWYVRGQPLTMMVGTEKVEFVTTGSARMVDASDLAFLGTVNGMAIYADKDDVKDIQAEIDELNRAQRGGSLSKILEEHKDLREDLAKVRTFYVPLQPTGCVFQAVLQQEQVRKNKQP